MLIFLYIGWNYYLLDNHISKLENISSKIVVIVFHLGTESNHSRDAIWPFGVPVKKFLIVNVPSRGRRRLTPTWI